MRRSLIVAALLVLGAGVPLAVAGTPTTTPAGEFFVLNVEVFPPRASEPGDDRGVTIRFERFNGNARSGRLPRASDPAIFRFQRGFRVNGRLLPSCRQEDLVTRGPSACPAGSLVGRGSAEADARPALATPVSARIRVFNAPPRGALPSLLIYAEAPEAGVKIIYTGLFSRLPSGPFGTAITVSPVVFQPPLVNPIEVTRFSVETIDRTAVRRVGGRRTRVHYVEAPDTCRRSWRFSETLRFADGESISAEDEVPCVAAG